MKNGKITNDFVPLFKISIDPELFAMSEKYYSDNWQSVIGKNYENFGKPFSYNLLCRKS